MKSSQRDPRNGLFPEGCRIPFSHDACAENDLAAISILVPVTMVVFCALAHRDHAAVRDFADGMLELDRRVVDAEVVEQPLFHIVQNAFADRRRNIGNGNMTGERVGL